MLMSDVIAQFRNNNPEMPSNVVSDAILQNWLLTGDKEFCAVTRCIISDIAINSVVATTIYDAVARYDLTTLITKFYDIDEYPGGGVIYDNKRLTKTSPAELDINTPNWRTRAAGTPKKFYRRGKYLYFDIPVSAVKTIRIYTVLISDDWTPAPDVMPFNQLSYMIPYHSSMVTYLEWKAKLKVQKFDEATAKRTEFLDYAKWTKTQIGGNKYSSIHYQPPNGTLGNNDET